MKTDKSLLNCPDWFWSPNRGLNNGFWCSGTRSFLIRGGRSRRKPFKRDRMRSSLSSKRWASGSRYKVRMRKLISRWEANSLLSMSWGAAKQPSPSPASPASSSRSACHLLVTCHCHTTNLSSACPWIHDCIHIQSSKWHHRLLCLRWHAPKS